MREKAVSVLMLILLFVGILFLPFSIHRAEAAVYGVEITSVTVWRPFMPPLGPLNVSYPTWMSPNRVDVTVHNNGTAPINITVNAYYYNATLTQQIGAPQYVSDLPPSNNVTLVFDWNLSSLTSCGNYIMKANATSPSGASHEFVKGQVHVRIVGDSDGDGDVDVGDLRKWELSWSLGDIYPLEMYIYYNSWPRFTDMDGDGDVDIGDLRKMQANLFETCPSPPGSAWISIYSPADSIAPDPPTAILQAGQTITVNVIVTNITDCAGYQIWINYSSTLVQLVSWTFDTDPANPLSPTQMAPASGERVDTNVSVAGSVGLATFWMFGVPRYSYVGSSVAAEITFQALTTGSVRFALDPVWTHATDNLGDDILFKNLVLRIGSDVDDDRDVDVGDQRKVQLAMFSTPGAPNWNPNADIDNDEDVDVGDQRIQQLYMFESW